MDEIVNIVIIEGSVNLAINNGRSLFISDQNSYIIEFHQTNSLNTDLNFIKRLSLAIIFYFFKRTG